MGGETRHAVATAIPHDATGWPWSTLLVNISGCLLIGVLMVVITERVRAHPLVRPLLGIGVLGGYLTTYSTFAYETFALAERRAVAVAAVNVAGSVVVGVAAAAAGHLLGGAIE